MGPFHRFVLAAGCAAALTASVACGGSGGDATATPAGATSTVAATATSTSGVAGSTLPTSVGPTPVGPTAVAPTVAAPTATAAPQGQGVTPALPTAVRATPTPVPPPPPAEQSLTVVAKDVKFVPNSLSATAGGVLHLTLDNQDAGVPHDMVLYAPSGAVAGAIGMATGPAVQTMTVTLGAPGRYAFKCSVHPTTMNGSIAVE